MLETAVLPATPTALCTVGAVLCNRSSWSTGINLRILGLDGAQGEEEEEEEEDVLVAGGDNNIWRGSSSTLKWMGRKRKNKGEAHLGQKETNVGEREKKKEIFAHACTISTQNLRRNSYFVTDLCSKAILL